MSEMINIIDSIPWYLWLVVFFIFIYIFRDKKVWAYRVNFEGPNSGDIDIDKYHRTNAKIEVEIELVEKNRNLPVQVFVNNSLVLIVPKERNSGREIDYTSYYEHQRPSEGDKLEVFIDGTVILSGELRSR